MSLFAATDEGVYQVSPDEPTPTLSMDDQQVVAFERGPEDTVYAAGSDLYRFGSNGWEALGVPSERVLSVAVTSDGVIYAGTSPPHVFVSDDGGNTWHRSTSFGSLSGREHWRFGGNYEGGPAAARVRAIAIPEEGPSERVFIGVETVGMFCTDDGGRSWVRRDSGLHADVHTLEAPTADRVIAGTGRGTYLTTNAGNSWRHLFTDRPLFWFTYTRDTAVFDGALYAGAQDRSEARHQSDARGALLRSTNSGRSWIRERVPGDDAAYPSAFTVTGSRIYAGLSDGRLLVRVGDDAPGEPGGEAGAVDDTSNDRLPEGADRSDWSVDRRWTTVCTLPEPITALG